MAVVASQKAAADARAKTARASEMPKSADQVKPDIETEDAFESVNSETEGVIRGVKLLGIRSRNKRDYNTPGVKKSGLALLNGVQVYIDHPDNPQTPRSYRDKIGVVENVTYRNGEGHFGDIRYNPKHEAIEQFLWDVKNAPKSLGMSINAKYKPGKTNKNGDQVVESLEMVRSVDVVTKPATADGIFEHESEDDDMALDLKTLKEKHADLVEQLRTELTEQTDESKEIERLRKEAREALEQVAAMKAEAEAKKLHDAVEAEVVKIFKDTPVDEATVKEVVECACSMQEDSRKKMLGVIGKLGPMLVETPDDDDADDGGDADEQEHEEKPEPAYKPAARKSGKPLNFRRDILGIS